MAVASLDPVPLERLAEHLRDGVWLDMRVVERGLLKRVRLFEIVVRRDEEDIGAEQEYLVESSEDNDQTEVGRTTYRFPQDMVRWAKPTSFTIEDIDRPLSEEEQEQMERAAEYGRQQAEWDSKTRIFDANPFNEFPPHQQGHSVAKCKRYIADNALLWVLRNKVLEAVEAKFGHPPAMILRGSDNGHSFCRKWCIRMMWELTNLPQYDIPEMFGYNSGGMSSDALWRTQDHANVAAELYVHFRRLMPSWTDRRGDLAPSCKQKKLLS